MVKSLILVDLLFPKGAHCAELHMQIYLRALWIKQLELTRKRRSIYFLC